jgi:hypothetical protein
MHEEQSRKGRNRHRGVNDGLARLRGHSETSDNHHNDPGSSDMPRAWLLGAAADPNLCSKDLEARESKVEGEGAFECKEGGSLQPFLVPILFVPLPCLLCQLCTAI